MRKKNVDDDLMIVKDSVRRWLKRDTIITQTTQGLKRPLVEAGDFTSLPISALNLLATILSLPFQLILASSVHKVMPNDKPFLARKLLAREWRQRWVSMKAGDTVPSLHSFP